MQRAIWTLGGFSLGFLLWACAAVPINVCPSAYKEYPVEVQKRAATEMRELKAKGAAPTLRSWIVDYGALRAQVRVLCGKD